MSMQYNEFKNTIVKETAERFLGDDYQILKIWKSNEARFIVAESNGEISLLRVFPLGTGESRTFHISVDRNVPLKDLTSEEGAVEKESKM